MCAHPDLCQKQKLDAEVELEEWEVEWVSACREGSEGEPEFLVHWAGGVEKWQAEAATWQSLNPVTVLAVWEKQSERESIMQGLQSASLVERNSLRARLKHGLRRCHSKGAAESSAHGSKQ